MCERRRCPAHARCSLRVNDTAGTETRWENIIKRRRRRILHYFTYCKLCLETGMPMPIHSQLKKLLRTSYFHFVVRPCCQHVRSHTTDSPIYSSFWPPLYLTLRPGAAFSSPSPIVVIRSLITYSFRLHLFVFSGSLADSADLRVKKTQDCSLQSAVCPLHLETRGRRVIWITRPVVYFGLRVVKPGGYWAGIRQWLRLVVS